MQLLPMASSPDGLISAWYAVIREGGGWHNASVSGRGGLEPKRLCIKHGPDQCFTGIHALTRLSVKLLQ